MDLFVAIVTQNKARLQLLRVPGRLEHVNAAARRGNLRGCFTHPDNWLSLLSKQHLSESELSRTIHHTVGGPMEELKAQGVGRDKHTQGSNRCGGNPSRRRSCRVTRISRQMSIAITTFARFVHGGTATAIYLHASAWRISMRQGLSTLLPHVVGATVRAPFM